MKKKKAECYSVKDAIIPLQHLYDFCISWIEDVQQCIGKKCATQGPVSRKSVQSLELIISSLKRVLGITDKVNPSYSSHIQLSSSLTLVVEHFFSKMRARNETPSPLAFDNSRILFPANTTVVVQPSFTSGISSAPSFLGKAKQQVADDDHDANVSIEIYTPSFEDCLIFLPHSIQLCTKMAFQS